MDATNLVAAIIEFSTRSTKHQGLLNCTVKSTSAHNLCIIINGAYTRAYIEMQEPRWGDLSKMAHGADEGQALALSCMAVK